MTQADFWKTHPIKSIKSKMKFNEFWDATKNDFWKSHPNMDEFSRNRSDSYPIFYKN